MKILLVNDDGINSEGIKTLDKVLSEKGHEVWVCAPESQRSACSHAIHMSHVKIQKVTERHFSCDGFPSDCVLYSVLGAIPMEKPDVVISGINQGFNISSDRHYSGTIGAAEEGMLKGVSSFAISCETVVKENSGFETMPSCRSFKEFPFLDAANFMAEHLEDLMNKMKPGYIININVPDNANGRWTWTTTGDSDYRDVVVETEPEVFELKDVSVPDIISENPKDTDLYAVFAKKLISVSYIQIAI